MKPATKTRYPTLFHDKWEGSCTCPVTWTTWRKSHGGQLQVATDGNKLQAVSCKYFQGLLTLLRMISGAKYSGVPHNVHVRPFTLLANPKSVTYNITKVNMIIKAPLHPHTLYLVTYTLTCLDYLHSLRQKCNTMLVFILSSIHSHSLKTIRKKHRLHRNTQNMFTP